MQLRAKIEKAFLSLIEGEDTWFTLRIDCSALDDDGALEIGEKHVFTAKDNQFLIGKRIPCDLRVWVRRKCSLDEKTVEKLGLSKFKIGELGFYPASGGGDFYPGRKATLEAMAYVSDALFEKLLTAFQALKSVGWLSLDVQKNGVLEYGWEPDGSRKVWKLESATEPSYINLERIDIGLDLIG